MKEELEVLEESVAKISVQQHMQYMRPPKGLFNEKTLKWSKDLGYTHVFWSLAFSDWNTDKQKGWEYAYDQVMDQVQPGAIVLLHTVSSVNAEALSLMIKDVRNLGYTFKRLVD